MYFLRLRGGSRNQNRNAKAYAYASYLIRKPQHADREHELMYVQHGNMPYWAKEDELVFWKSADRYERKNGRLWNELVGCLPRELNSEQRFNLAIEFLEKEIGNHYPYTMVIHESIATDGSIYPHFHIMFSHHKLDGIERDKEKFFKRYNSKSPEIGGAKKDKAWNVKYKVEELRLSWELTANKALELAGLELRIDRRSLKEQGISRPPEPVLEPYHTQLLKRGIITPRIQVVLDLREERRQEYEQRKERETAGKNRRAKLLLASYDRLTERLETVASKVKILAKELSAAENSIERTIIATPGLPPSQSEAMEQAESILWGRGTDTRVKLLIQLEAQINQIQRDREERRKNTKPLSFIIPSELTKMALEEWHDRSKLAELSHELSNARQGLKLYQESQQQDQQEILAQEISNIAYAQNEQIQNLVARRDNISANLMLAIKEHKILQNKFSRVENGLLDLGIEIPEKNLQQEFQQEQLLELVPSQAS